MHFSQVSVCIRKLHRKLVQGNSILFDKTLNNLVIHEIHVNRPLRVHLHRHLRPIHLKMEIMCEQIVYVLRYPST